MINNKQTIGELKNEIIKLNIIVNSINKLVKEALINENTELTSLLVKIQTITQKE